MHYELSDDFAEFFARVESPTTTNYRGYQVYKQSFGSQGPVLLEALNILEQFDLKSMKRNSGPYLHTIVEALKRIGDEPHDFDQDDLLVVSIGTGVREEHYRQELVRRWGRLGWSGNLPILPRSPAATN